MNIEVDWYQGSPPALVLVSHQTVDTVALTALHIAPSALTKDVPNIDELSKYLTTEGIQSSETTSVGEVSERVTTIFRRLRRIDEQKTILGFASIIAAKHEENDRTTTNVAVACAGQLAIIGILAGAGREDLESARFSNWPRVSNEITSLDQPRVSITSSGELPTAGLHIFAGPPNILLTQPGDVTPNDPKRSLQYYAQTTLIP